jgi:uncharacterized peroxidase-related enzyme
MSRLPLVDSETATPQARALLEATAAQLGRTPNLYRAMASAPAALAGYLGFRAALVAGELDVRMRERLALLVAEENRCGYCVAAHTFRGGKVGLPADELALTRVADSRDPKVAAALAFARAVVRERGDVRDAALADVRAAGWGDAAIGEIVGHVALNVFSNYFNHVARPPLDFPAAEAAAE